jgi:alpha-N-arabinofuranosidase
VSTEGDSALISLSNVSLDESRVVELDLRGRSWEVVEARILTSDSANDHNSPVVPDAVAPRDFAAGVSVVEGTTGSGAVLRVELPAHSFATVSLTLS